MSADYWLGNLAAWSMQAAICVAGGGLAAWAFRLRVPRIRLAYWHALMAICLLLPAWEPWQHAADAQVVFTTLAADPAVTGRTSGFALPWRQMALWTLAAGCGIRMLWLIAGFLRLRRWRRDTQVWSPVSPRLQQLRAAVAPRAELRLADALSGPVTFGFWRPLVVLPGQFAGLPEAIQEAVLCHELLHVRRRDWIVTVAEQFLRAVLWFHPAIWWLTGQAQLAREQTVDGEVVAFTKNRAQYLDALLAMAGNRPALDLAPAALFLRKRHLKNRVALLLKEASMSKGRLISFCAASCGVLFAAGWLALHSFPLQAAPAPQEQTGSALLHSVPPVYPQAAKDKHIEGDVVLEVQIDARGHVTNAQVLSGPEELRNAARDAVLQWHYSPEAMMLPATTQVTVEFKLPREGPQGAPFTLKSIQVEGLSGTARDELLGRLPVHVGDTIDAAALRSVSQVARAFDEHLVVAAGRGDGALRIFIPPPVVPGGPVPARIRVGSDVQRAKLLVKVNPIYPPEAKAQHIQGLVRLMATLDKEGKVANLQVISGDPILAAAALDAVRQWQYQTTLLNGEPVEVATEIVVNFTLSE